MIHRRLHLLVLLLSMALPLLASDAKWQEITKLGDQVGQSQAKAQDLRACIVHLGETIPPGKDKALDEARQKLAAAEAAAEPVRAASGAAAVREKFQLAAAERDALADKLLSEAAFYKDLLAQHAKARGAIEAASPRLQSLGADEARLYAQAKVAEGRLGGEIHRYRRAVWERGEVKDAYKKADALYEKIGATQKPKAIADAEGAVREARKALSDAQSAAAQATGLARAELAELAAIDESLAKLKAAQAALQQALRVEWVSTKVQMPGPAPKPEPGKDLKPKVLSATVEIPAGCKQVRGFLLTMMGTVRGDIMVRSALAAEGFAVVEMDGTGLFTKDTEKETFTAFIAKLAEKSNHPELVHVPWIPAGCSTTTITARNIAAWKPDRAVGIIHFAGGNLQEHPADPGWSLSGIPFLAISGELECFGPIGGIRPEYGRQTQWVMIREQFQRLRTKDPGHLISLVVIPGADHARWSGAVSPLAAMFVSKAIKARLPEGAGMPTAPVVCRPVPPESGWLTDPDLTTPSIAAAPVARYAGDKGKAFWHFDEEMASAVDAYHRGKLQLPDPTRKSPVPADWPPGEKR